MKDIKFIHYSDEEIESHTQVSPTLKTSYFDRMMINQNCFDASHRHVCMRMISNSKRKIQPYDILRFIEISFIRPMKLEKRSLAREVLRAWKNNNQSLFDTHTIITREGTEKIEVTTIDGEESFIYLNNNESKPSPLKSAEEKYYELMGDWHKSELSNLRTQLKKSNETSSCLFLTTMFFAFVSAVLAAKLLEVVE